MNENLRMVFIVIVFAVASALLWTLVTGDSDDPTDQSPVSPTQVTSNEADAPVFEFDEPDRAQESTDSSIPEQEDVATSAPNNANDDPKWASGAGSISLSVKTDDGRPIPDDLVVQLHSLTDSNRNDLDTESLRDSKRPDADHKVEFTNLPLGEYGVLGNSATHTGTYNRELTKIRPQATSTLTLYPGANLYGNVVDEQGAGIPSARLFIAGYTQGGNETDVGLMRSRLSGVKAEEDGSFVIGNLQIRDVPLQYRLLAHAEGYVNVVTDYYAPGTTGITIVLPRGRTLSGTVVDRGANEMVVNTGLTFTQGSAVNIVQTRTDGEGAFVVDGLGEGEYAVGIDDEIRVATEESSKLVLDSASFDKEHVIEVMPGGMVTGRVINEETDTGIPDVTLRAYPRGHQAKQKEVVSDASGNYRITGLLQGGYEIRFDEVKGYSKSFREENRRNISTTLGQTVPNIDFTLKRGLLITGRAVDEHNKPLEMVIVDADEVSGGNYEYDRTDEKGNFIIAGLKPNVEVRLRGRKQDYSSLNQVLNTGEEGLTGVVVQMFPDSKISGIVVDESGKPKPRMQMHARATGGPNAQGGSPIENTDGNGEFILEGLLEGEYNIFVYYDGSNYDKPAETLTLKAGEHKKDVRIVFKDDEGGVIAGTVTDTDGNPVRYADLNLQGVGWGNASPDAAGKFRFSGVKDGNHSISVRAQNYMSQTVRDVTAGMNDVRIVLEKAGIISGHIFSAASGEPIPDFSIKLTNATPYLIKYFEAYHHDEGEYSVNDVNGPTATLTVRAEGYAEKDFAVTGVRPGETLVNTDIYLEAANSLTGRVISSNGDAVSGAMIFTGTPPNGNYERERDIRDTTDRDGQFALGSLGLGELQVTAYHASYAQQTVTTNISSGDSNSLEIVLSQGGTVTGTITINGGPASGVNLYISGNSPDNRFHENTTSNSEGIYRIGGLPEGVHNLSAHTEIDGQQRSFNQDVELVNDLVTEVNFDFLPGTSIIEGYIFIAENETSAGRVSLQVDTGSGIESRYQEIGSNEAYRFENLPAGEITLRAWGTSGGNGNKTATASLGDGETLRLDLLLYGGGTVRASFANVQDGAPAYAMILRGVHDIPASIDQSTIQSLSQSLAGNAAIQNGAAEFATLDPGEYTIIAVIYDLDAEGRPTFPTNKVTGGHVSILNANETQDISLSF